MKRFLIGLLIISFIAVSTVASAEYSFSKSFSVPAFNNWLQNVKIPGYKLLGATDEGDGYVGYFKGSKGEEAVGVTVYDLRAFNNPGPQAKKMTYKGHDAYYDASGSDKMYNSMIMIKFTESKATVTIGYMFHAKKYSQAEVEKLVESMQPEKYLK